MPDFQPDTMNAAVDASAARRISTDLWGIFFEDISSSADGGLASELVQNGAFEYSRADHRIGATIRRGASWCRLTRSPRSASEPSNRWLRRTLTMRGLRSVP